MNLKVLARINKVKIMPQLDRRMRGILVPLLLRFLAPKNYDLANTLVIAGAPRSGTTWLAELVNTTPGSAILFEPLHLWQVPEARKAGFKWETIVKRGISWPEGEAFMRRVLSGQVLNSWTMSQVSLKQAINVNQWIVKFVRANMLLDWLAHTFPIRPPALVIRHPCACVASYLRKGWKAPLRPAADHEFFQVHPHLHSVCNEIETMEEIMAFGWCLNYYMALTEPQPLSFHIVSYERLVRKGQEELEKLFSAWRMPLSEKVSKRLSRPSMTASPFSKISKGNDPLESWQGYLNPEQKKRILAVVKAFGLDFYSEDPEPDYDRLYSSSPVSLKNLAEKIS